MDNVSFTEHILQGLIFVHAALGGFALVAGLVAMSSKKGRAVHKKAGRIFYYALLSSALIALVVTLMPNHTSPFFFCISLLTLYLLISGKRSLSMKSSEHALIADRILAILIIITGIGMILYPLFLYGKMNLILLVFGLVSCLFGLLDLYVYRSPAVSQKHFLKLHLSKMTGAYIATVTAFTVVNKFFSGLLSWFLPSILGTLLIIYWLFKFSNRRTRSA
ncbi:hypothetical protein [Marinicella sp. W31]|uniref:hypothetical protein n=1 Tax=Marinicella sp. W31 TaxID=3023713 RepID=UPI00375682FD